jgi:hypothetical protein
VFHNAVGNTRGNVTVSTGVDAAGDGSATVSSVVMEDLLYDTPVARRPRIVLGDGSVVPLQPRHVYMVKVDVEGFDVAALHGLRRLLMEDERPVAVGLTLVPTGTSSGTLPCNTVSFVLFMYEQGYVYEGVVSVDTMVDMVLAATDSPRSFSGWWRHRDAFPSVVEQGFSRDAPVSDAPANVEPPASGDTSCANGLRARAHVPQINATHFCCDTGSVDAARTSRFSPVVSDAVREASRRVWKRGGAAARVDVATVDAFVDGLSTQAPCFWARDTSLPLPDGVNMSACTHDPAEDTVLSSRIHNEGTWFGPAVWIDFAAMLDDSGSCPPDRPVVLDLGLNIG